MGDQTENGCKSWRPFSSTLLMRYCPGVFADSRARSSDAKAFLPSFQVIEIWQKVANLKYPTFVRSAFVCMFHLSLKVAA